MYKMLWYIYPVEFFRKGSCACPLTVSYRDGTWMDPIQLSHPIEMALEERVELRSDDEVVRAFLKELHEKI